MLVRQIPIAAIFFLATAHVAVSQSNAAVESCFSENLANNGEELLGIAPSRIQKITEDVVYSLGMSMTDIELFPCQLVSNAIAWIPMDVSLIPRKRYIVYNPDWVRGFAGWDEWQMVALLGHELGHFVLGHQLERTGNARVRMEMEADRYAGCAVARLGGPWAAVHEVMYKLRSLRASATYPSRNVSIILAEAGYCGCGGDVNVDYRQRCEGTFYYLVHSTNEAFSGECSSINNYCKGIYGYMPDERIFVSCQ